MKSRLLFLTVLLIIICASCQPKKKTEPEKKAVTGATYTNPLRERGAEPWAVFYEGKYYYTQGSESRIMLWETSGYQPIQAIPITYGLLKCIASTTNGIFTSQQTMVIWTITRFM